MENCKELKHCVCCDGVLFRQIIDLGNQVPANNYAIKEKFPLRLNECLKCGHLQLSHSVNPDLLFSDNPYLSASSGKEYQKWFVEFCLKHKFKNVLDIACNDGTLLDEFKIRGFETFGIEPSKKQFEISSQKHKIYNCFFPCSPIEKYDLIVAQNVLAHTPDPLTFLKECGKRMHRNSVLLIQNSQADMYREGQFDTIYHEHISHFSPNSFRFICENSEMEIVGTKRVKIHGGSIIYSLKKLMSFQDKANEIRDEFKRQIEKFRGQGKNIIVYGAAAKMINMLRYSGITPDYIIDETPTKIGQMTDVGVITDTLPESGVIIPVWNFFEEIKEKVEKKYPGKYEFYQYLV